MRALIDRYLDGDLAAEEAEALLTALQQDPELERELQQYEKMLAAVAETPAVGPPGDFVDRVMSDVHRLEQRLSPAAVPARRRVWRPSLAVAASVILVFAAGYMAARLGADALRQEGGTTVAEGNLAAEVLPVSTAWQAGAGGDGLRLVRLVYMPGGGEVSNVEVAGTFNGWDPARTPMQQQGAIWVATLLLPPETYEYMFVENGMSWKTDPMALQTRDDGFGRKNAVLDLTL